LAWLKLGSPVCRGTPCEERLLSWGPGDSSEAGMIGLEGPRSRSRASLASVRTASGARGASEARTDDRKASCERQRPAALINSP